MIRRVHVRAALVVAALLALTTMPVAATQDSGKRPLTHDDYDGWKRIQDETLSPDGEWVAYSAVPQEGDGELVVHHAPTGREYRHPRGTDSTFTADSEWVVFTIEPPEEEVEEAEEENVPPPRRPKNALGIMSLADGSVDTVERVQSFRLPEEAGGWVAYRLEEPVPDEESAGGEGEESGEPEAGEEAAEDEEEEEKEKDYGTELVLRSLADGSDWRTDSVLEYRFTDDAGWLVYTVSSEADPATDGVYAYQPAAATGSALLTGAGTYERLAFDEGQERLAFVTDRATWDQEVSTFELWGWNVGDTEAELWVAHGSNAGFPSGMAVSEKSPVSFSEDGSVVMFGIAEIPEPEADEADDDGAGDDGAGNEEEEADFDLWHWNDPYPQPQQEQMADEVRNETWETVYHLDSGDVVQLADEAIPDVSLSRDGTVAIGNTRRPYTKLVSWDGRYADVWIIDTSTGDRTLVAEKIRGFFGGGSLSPGGGHVVWFDHRDYDWHAYDVAAGTESNLTASLDVRFDREDHDRPEPASPYGVAGWTDDGGSVLVYDRYDIWEIRPDGSDARMITEGFGRDNDLSFRRVDLDPDREAIDPTEPLLLRTTNEETMASGFYRDQVQGDDPPQAIVMEDLRYGFPRVADDADVLLYDKQRFDLYPDLWVSGLDFEGKKVSDLGSQTGPFLWGSAELRDFHSADGLPLKGILVTPENFDPDEEYPLMVYIYETLHQGLHRFRAPSPGTSINPSYYVSNGYVLWMPDIEYGTGYPGKDALKCVLPGIHMLVNEGFVDPDRIGIQGHSWGGYQIAYMVTQTDIFAAAEAGAPVSNMTSAYGGIRWGSGMVRQFQYEQTQSRLGDSLWAVPLRYIENSPLFWADKIETPLLMIHNDDDGAVPWYQGIEMIMAMRRLGKPAWMFNYNGEAHGLRQRVNQEDWTVRMQQFFDHYLKDGPEPEWMTEGIQAWEKDDSGS